MNHKLIDDIVTAGIVAVIRAETAEAAEKVAKACLAGGIKAIEITFTVPGALTVITTLKQDHLDSDIILGAGTILDAETAEKAITAGASFIVSPGFDVETAKVCLRNNVPYLPGCLTVTEMMTARSAGAKLIKLFPGSAFGPSYVKAIKGPLPDIMIMPTGGVSLDNIKDWFAAGVSAVGVGGELTTPAKHGDYAGVTENAKAFVTAVKAARNKA